MTIYQVIYLNNYNEKVADFGFYVDKIDAEKRAFEVRMNAPLESGTVKIQDIFIHDHIDSKKKSSLDEIYSFKS